MMRNLTKIAVAVFLSAGLAGGASAELIAGWDFSQYSTDGSLDSGSGNADTLPANYSCPSVNSGTLFMDGSFGSTDVDELATFSDVLPEVVARANFTRANRTAPLRCDSLPTPGFDEPPAAQTHKSKSGLIARVAADLVFQGTRSASATGDWSVSFASFNSIPGPPIPVDVEFAADCAGYVLVDTVMVVSAERSYGVPLSAGLNDDEVCVRLALPAGAVVDNVAIALPEPAGSTAMLAGVTGLLALVRLRSRTPA